MRIISGIHKGRRIIAPKKLPVRPTTDRSKEALFNILQHQIEFSELTVLDLFSGTGSISYEFSSRGVKQITAVDKNEYCVQFIRTTSALLSLNIRKNKKDCVSFLKEDNGIYNLIFADPPYDFDIKIYWTIILIAQRRLMNNGQLIIEHFNKIDLSEIHGYDSSRSYGSVTFSFFKI